MDNHPFFYMCPVYVAFRTPRWAEYGGPYFNLHRVLGWHIMLSVYMGYNTISATGREYPKL